jgi:hypothetical protein
LVFQCRELACSLPRITESVTANRSSLEALAEPSDMRPGLSNGLLYGWQFKRSLMTLFAIPHLGDPNSVSICGIVRHDVAETARHRADALQKRCSDRIAFARGDLHLPDESKHRLLLVRRVCRQRCGDNARSNSQNKVAPIKICHKLPTRTAKRRRHRWNERLYESIYLYFKTASMSAVLLTVKRVLHSVFT